VSISAPPRATEPVPAEVTSATGAGRCPACGAGGGVSFYEARQVPVHSTRFLADRASALAIPRGDVRLQWCRSCDFISNQRFDPSLVDYTVDGYEDSQMSSPTFRAFATELADHLAGRYQLRGGCVLEVGAGRGEFLELMARRGDLVGIGVDPASPDREEPGLHLRRERLGPEHALVPFDLLCCRHTLEHIAEVGAFLRLVRSVTAGARRPVFFEVPDAERILREAAFWDVYYEHCSYFTMGSLRSLFAREGFEIVELRRGYGDQYLLCEAVPAGHAPRPVPDGADEPVAESVVGFLRSVGATLARVTECFDEARRSGRRVVAWGAGSKAVALLSAVPAAEIIQQVVDVDPRKHGRYLPGSGCAVIAPTELVELQPDLVMVMNPMYEGEITSQLRQMGVPCPVATL
jgi:hypothetical protein